MICASCHPFNIILGIIFFIVPIVEGVGDINDHPPRDFNENFRMPKYPGPSIRAEYVENGVQKPLKKDADTRIVNGQNSRRGESKFYTMILDKRDGRYVFSGCGGSQITNCHILTAAHCVDEDRLALIDGVMVGAWQPYNGNGGEDYHFSKISSPSSMVTLHPNYNSVTSQYDIAIIRIDECITSDQFQPIELAKTGYDSLLNEGETLRAFGFGRTAEGDESVVHILQTAQLPYIPREKCEPSLTKKVSSDMMCAGYENGGIDTCEGDSGGPLVQEKNGHIVQVGVTSWGVGCARRKSPGVYSSIPESYDWIVSVVCNDAEVNSNICLDPPSSAPSSAPSGSPSSVPTHTPASAPDNCVARNGYCNQDDDCCAGHCDRTSKCNAKPREIVNSKQRQKMSSIEWDELPNELRPYGGRHRRRQLRQSASKK